MQDPLDRQEVPSSGREDDAPSINEPSHALESPTHAFESTETLSKTCTFSSIEFYDVMFNLVKNPNITSSHLFRADIFWDSDRDSTFQPEAMDSDTQDLSSFVKHMKPELRPWKIQMSGFVLRRTIVRQLIPRNPQLDKPLLQTCQFMSSLDELPDAAERELVVYLPHVESEDQMPFYHPPLRALVFLHTTQEVANFHSSDTAALKNLSIHWCPFYASAGAKEIRTSRTLQALLKTIHKHSTSRKTGYIKRVHHDQVVSQKASQDTYTRLKAKHAKTLITSWKEQTDVTKSVFEDLGIAAFLLELWAIMYDCPSSQDKKSEGDPQTKSNKQPFPGFVDIGCGNGLLVYILVQEGYPGWGFDARTRKTWDAFPLKVRECLKEMTLLPSVLGMGQDPRLRGEVHSGAFARHAFIVSNHADELTPWTPLLAYLNDSPYISIPCCSHDLSGAKWRFGRNFAKLLDDDVAAELKIGKEESDSIRDDDGVKGRKDSEARDQNAEGIRTDQSPETTEVSDEGRKPSKSKPTASTAAPRATSAYATLCGYVMHLSRELGYTPEKEFLRIPSTRNTCIIGRRRRPHLWGAGEERTDSDAPSGGGNVTKEGLHGESSSEERWTLKEELVRRLVQKEMRSPIEQVATVYVERAMGVYNGKNRNH